MKDIKVINDFNALNVNELQTGKRFLEIEQDDEMTDANLYCICNNVDNKLFNVVVSNLNSNKTTNLIYSYLSKFYKYNNDLSGDNFCFFYDNDRKYMLSYDEDSFYDLDDNDYDDEIIKYVKKYKEKIFNDNTFYKEFLEKSDNSIEEYHMFSIKVSEDLILISLVNDTISLKKNNWYKYMSNIFLYKKELLIAIENFDIKQYLWDLKDKIDNNISNFYKFIITYYYSPEDYINNTKIEDIYDMFKVVDKDIIDKFYNPIYSDDNMDIYSQFRNTCLTYGLVVYKKDFTEDEKFNHKLFRQTIIGNFHRDLPIDIYTGELIKSKASKLYEDAESMVVHTLRCDYYFVKYNNIYILANKEEIKMINLKKISIDKLLC